MLSSRLDETKKLLYSQSHEEMSVNQMRDVHADKQYFGDVDNSNVDGEGRVTSIGLCLQE